MALRPVRLTVDGLTGRGRPQAITIAGDCVPHGGFGDMQPHPRLKTGRSGIKFISLVSMVGQGATNSMYEHRNRPRVSENRPLQVWENHDFLKKS